MLGLKRKMAEVPVSKLSGFVLAPADNAGDLSRAAVDPAAPHPRISLLTVGGKVRSIIERSVAGLREAEVAAEATTQAERDAETRNVAHRVHAERMRTERDWLKMLRRERKSFNVGQGCWWPTRLHSRASWARW